MREAIEGMNKLPLCGRLIRQAHATLLHTPMFYRSENLEGHRDEYYDRLLAVSRDDDWTGWCEFFLAALTKQAEANHAKAVASRQRNGTLTTKWFLLAGYGMPSSG